MAYISSTKDVVEHLQNDVLQSYEKDVIFALECHEKAKRGGLFSLPRGVFCYISYLAGIIYGDDGTQGAVTYMEEYLGPINPRYKFLSIILYKVWRHGTVHEHKPKVLKDELNNVTICWSCTASSYSKYSHNHLTANRGPKDSSVVFIHVYCDVLAQDMRRSLKNLIADLGSNLELRARSQANFDKRSKTVEHLTDRLGSQLRDKAQSQANWLMKNLRKVQH